jgi:hypothetical protein
MQQSIEYLYVVDKFRLDLKKLLHYQSMIIAFELRVGNPIGVSSIRTSFDTVRSERVLLRKMYWLYTFDFVDDNL